MPRVLLPKTVLAEALDSENVGVVVLVAVVNNGERSLTLFTVPEPLAAELTLSHEPRKQS